MSSTSVTILAAIGAFALFAVSWRWSLPPSRAAWIIALGTIAGFVGGWELRQNGATLWAVAPLVWMIQGATFIGIILWLFYRDPERSVPTEPDVIVSPADGVVIYLRRLEAGEPPRSVKNGAAMVLEEMQGTALEREPLWHLGISMVFTDVHVNRAPIAGRVIQMHHRPGKFLSLRSTDALGLNERQTLVIGNNTFQVGLVQIASRLVRQIVAYVGTGDVVERGQRLGMIRFGSQVDVFIPAGGTTPPNVSVGQRLIAGETVICRRITGDAAHDR